MVLGFFDSLAIIGKNWKGQKLSYCDTSLYFSCLKTIIGRGEIFCVLLPFFVWARIKILDPPHGLCWMLKNCTLPSGKESPKIRKFLPFSAIHLKNLDIYNASLLAYIYILRRILYWNRDQWSMKKIFIYCTILLIIPQCATCASAFALRIFGDKLSLHADQVPF